MRASRYGEYAETMPMNGRSNGSSKRVLVVEDSPSARKLMQELLLRLGVPLPDIRLASTVPEALQFVAQWNPDIVFLDLQLRPPVDATPAALAAAQANPSLPKNGADLALQLRARNPSLKLVVCSASEPAGTSVADLVKKGEIQSIVKPVLAARVREVLDLYSGPSATRRRP